LPAAFFAFSLASFSFYILLSLLGRMGMNAFRGREEGETRRGEGEQSIRVRMTAARAFLSPPRVLP